jgi:DNA-binding transcriptional MerR regulator
MLWGILPSAFKCERAMSESRDKVLTLAELARKASLPGRTIRFYIARGLLPAPRRGGRGAAYGPEHLDRLRQIRELQRKGSTLREIARDLAGEPGVARAPIPSTWWDFAIGEDVVVSVRTDASPWRMKRIRKLVHELAAEVGPPGE